MKEIQRNDVLCTVNTVAHPLKPVTVVTSTLYLYCMFEELRVDCHPGEAEKVFSKKLL